MSRLILMLKPVQLEQRRRMPLTNDSTHSIDPSVPTPTKIVTLLFSHAYALARDHQDHGVPSLRSLSYTAKLGSSPAQRGMT